MLFLTFAVAGCATAYYPQQLSTRIQPGESRVSFVTTKHKAKPHNAVTVYSNHDHLQRPYRIIGKEVVSRYNFIGLERQSKALNDIMQNLAASMGGDAIINLKVDNQKIEGTVISFEKIVL